MVDTTVSFNPEESDYETEDDGVLKTFIDRYTTMLIHDSAYMEELPAP